MWPFNKPFGANLTQRHYSLLHNICLKTIGWPFIWSKGELALKYLAPKMGDRILDIGCGIGLFASEYAAHGAQVVGIDLDAKEIGAISSDMTNLQKKLSFVAANATSIPFRENSFNKITILDCLEHIEQDETVIGEIHRVLAPDGLVLITVPTYPGYPPNRVFTRIIPLLPKSLLRKASKDKELTLTYTDKEDSISLAEADTDQILKAFGHVRHYAPESLVALLKKQNFKILHARQFQKLFESEMMCFHFGVRGCSRPSLYPIMRAIAFLDCFLPNSYPGVEFLVVAQKIK